MNKIISDVIVWKNRPEKDMDMEDFQKEETHHIYVRGSFVDPQSYFAWEYFKNSKYVLVNLRETMDDIEIYEVKVTYKSPSERFEEDTYGIDNFEDEY